MALYRYAPDRDALLDGIVEMVLDELPHPETGQDWQTQLRRGAHDFRRLALAHPNVVSLIVTRPAMMPLGRRPPGSLRPLENLLHLLTTSGFDTSMALHCYRLYVGFLFGHVLTELQSLAVEPVETDDLLRLALHHLPAREFPLLRSVATELAIYDGLAELDTGLDILFSGFEHHILNP